MANNIPDRYVPGQPLPRRSARYVARVHSAVLEERAAIHAIETVAMAAGWAALTLKRQQKEMELTAPEASAELALIFNTSCMHLSRRVAMFGEGLG